MNNRTPIPAEEKNRPFRQGRHNKKAIVSKEGIHFATGQTEAAAAQIVAALNGSDFPSREESRPLQEDWCTEDKHVPGCGCEGTDTDR
jgi:hypothetical protein